MKKSVFLAKLRKELKLELVEPSNEITQSYIQKSESNISSAKILLSNNKLEESVALAYYSMYHFVTALFFKVGIKSENHTASIILLKEIFSIGNADISFAKKERLDKQYYVDFHITKEEVIESIKKAENFNNFMRDFISKVNNESINSARNKFDILTKR